MDKLQRRKFLKTVVVTAGTLPLIHLTGCSDDNNNNNTSTDTTNTTDTTTTEISYINDAAFFPQSVTSGDPRANSVILWTRFEDSAYQEQDVTLYLQVATDTDFVNVVVDHAAITAYADFDHCVRVKVQNLSPYTTYYYRFLRETGNELEYYITNTGRTKTAPLASQEFPISFAFASCQDYIGRYYNTYHAVLENHDDLDFIVHLGDYIYETTGDPSFQTSSPDRVVTFTDQTGAIDVNGSGSYYAAQSLSNYRQLYQTVRSDSIMQEIHEKFPMIVIWDDHEFSDDCFGATATYYDDKQDEYNETRRRNSEQAWFEYMPIDDDISNSSSNLLDILKIDNSILYPNTTIYRSFDYGSYLHLNLTDLRTYRPNHLINEDAFPGTIIFDAATLTVALGETVYVALSASFSPYVVFENLDATTQATLIAAITAGYEAAGLANADATTQATAVLTGNLDANYLNSVLEAAGASALAIDTTDLSRGFSYMLLGKTDLYSSLGSRYLVVQSSFDLYTQIMAALGLSDENILSTDQQNFQMQALQSSNATWKVIGNSISSTSMVLDLTVDPATLSSAEAQQALTAIQNTPELQILAQRFYLNVDQWDGFPNKRTELLAEYRGMNNVVLLAGDIHAAFVTDHNNVIELTTSSISSGTFQSLLQSQVAATELSQIPGIEALIAELETLMVAQPGVTGQNAIDQTLEYVNTSYNGIVVVNVMADALEATYYLLEEEQVFTNSYENAENIVNQMQVQTFRVENGSVTQI